MNWDTHNDVISPVKFKLNDLANTKRKILSSIAANYDIYNIGGPMLNRARIFMHILQSDQKVGWDKPLESNLCKEWKKISNQINQSPHISINRFVGNRDGRFHLVAYVDASRYFYGAVIYIIEESTSRSSFLFAKNRMITKNLKSKSIASLELQAVEFGTKILHKTRDDLCGEKAMVPIKISKLSVLQIAQSV